MRFIAFLAVFLHHVLPRGGGNSFLLSTAANAMGFGLCLFLVLSAYLIAMLLLREREQTGSIHLVSFYTRRILRIWPLYLLGLGIGVFRAYSHGVLDQQKTWFVAALLLAGNLVIPTSGALMSHLWSISVEEQFYLFFPTACKNFPRRGMFVFAIALIVMANLALVYFVHVGAELDTTVWFSSFVQFEMFAAGILLALADARLPRWSTPVSLLAAAASIGLWVLVDGAFHLKTAGARATSIPAACAGYALVALSCCVFLVAMQGLSSPPALEYAGKISFGLYVFHIPVIALLSARLHPYPLACVVCLAVTCGIAALSYQFYEKPFLRMKRRFELVPTRAS